MSDGFGDAHHLRPVSVTGSGLLDSGTARATVEQVMAGFIVWLARRDVPAGRRHRYHAHAEHYLRWRASQPDHTEDYQDHFLTRLRRQGASDNEHRVAHASLVLLQHHLTIFHSGWI